ncbi:tetraacyldisaccharide 4'-kinase [Persicobacter sp. CCB-QB2]|uniref:tetraacyldisaccharide 4'-kinase n=1 Tax=Persicobacter sp. CCB-QB2 TaxID=1561025 RepID=UPI0006A9673B|nr:tetraacyldisaccharide 4'-kinase [Persicobacter sp. CCB-QB2]
MSIRNIVGWPFSVLYGSITRLRNHLFDIGYTKSFNFEVMTINVGNLSVGGTGKSPMIEYLARLLKKDFRTATLSRGYGRKTRGFQLAGLKDNALTLGDEPFQFYRKFGTEIMVAVGEERALAIPEMLQHQEDLELILLDDAFQHRYVQADLNIMLTEYDRPFFHDFILPAGRLREARKGADRADIIVVTKCPDQIQEANYRAEIQRYAPEASVFFSKIAYGRPQALENGQTGAKVYLFSGIAQPGPFEEFVGQQYEVMAHERFSDHHAYTEEELRKIAENFKASGADFILTTEKDAVKLVVSAFDSWRKDLPLFYLPIEVEFLKDQMAFDALIKAAIEKKYAQ